MGHPVHPRGFRVGKSLPWHFASHRYDFDPASFLVRELSLMRLMRRRFLRFFPLRRYGLVPGVPRLAVNQDVLTVTFPIFNSAYDIFLRRYRFRRYMAKRRGSIRRRRRRSRRPKAGGTKIIHRRRRYMSVVRRYLRLLRRWRRRYFGKKFLVRQYRRYHKPKRKLPRWHRRALRRDPTFKPRRRWNAGIKKRKLNPKKFPATSLARFYADPMARGRFRRQTPFRLRRRCLLLLRGLRREIRTIWPQRIRIKLLPMHFGNVTAKLLAYYVVRRFRLGYKVNRIVYPLLSEARRMAGVRGLFFRFKGRLTRKARASLNSRSFRYGRIGFATVDSPVDYASQAFETRYGVCTVQVWIARRRPSKEAEQTMKKNISKVQRGIPLSRYFGNGSLLAENKAEMIRLYPFLAYKQPKRPSYHSRRPWQKAQGGKPGSRPWQDRSKNFDNKSWQGSSPKIDGNKPGTTVVSEKPTDKVFSMDRTRPNNGWQQRDVERDRHGMAKGSPLFNMPTLKLMELFRLNRERREKLARDKAKAAAMASASLTKSDENVVVDSQVAPLPKQPYQTNKTVKDSKSNLNSKHGRTH